jgi:hypothetical protein
LVAVAAVVALAGLIVSAAPVAPARADADQNQAPLAVDDAFTVGNGLIISFNPLANDHDPDGDELTFALISQPAHGELVCDQSGSCSHRPAADYTGADAFVYRIADPAGLTAEATVSLEVVPSGGVSLFDDLVEVTPGETVGFDVLANDYLPYGGHLSVWRKPANGTATCDGAGRCSYTAGPGFVADSFTYTVTGFDPVTGDSFTADATVRLTAGGGLAGLGLAPLGALRGAASDPVVEAGPDLTVGVDTGAGEDYVDVAVFDFSASTPTSDLTAYSDWATYSGLATYKVDFGDGQSSYVYGNFISRHAYAAVGTYTVTLTLSSLDSGGRIQTLSDTTVVTVVQSVSYLRVEPVAGSQSGGEVTLRIKLWQRAGWVELAGQPVTVTVGGHSATVTTDARGEGLVRLPWSSGQSATAEFAGDSDHGAVSSGNDFALFGLPQGDVIFLMDDSGSTSSYQNAVWQNIDSLATQLGGSIDYQFGVVAFGGAASTPVPLLLQVADDDLNAFSQAVNYFKRDGATEMGLNAVATALESRVGLRPEAGKCLVLVTDEGGDQGDVTEADAEAALQGAGATLFGIMPDPATLYRELYSDLIADSGGTIFDLDDFVNGGEAGTQAVLTALASACTQTVLSRPDISVTVTDQATVTTPSAARTYTVTVRNDGAVGVTGVALSLELAGSQTIVSVGQSGASPAGTVTWPTFDLALGASAVFTVNVRTAATAVDQSELTATATAADDGSQGADLTPINNTATDTTVVVVTGPVEQTVRVVYVDDDADGAEVAPAIGTRTVLIGPSGSAVGFSAAMAQAGTPASYDYVSLDNVDAYDDDPAVDQTITVHLRQHREPTPTPTPTPQPLSGTGARVPWPLGLMGALLLVCGGVVLVARDRRLA